MVAGEVRPNRESVLLRSWIQTDMSTEDRSYHGVVSEPFPPPFEDCHVVSADWSEAGWVQVTWLITRDMPDPITQLAKER
jgi:hypothetical protein